MRKVLIVGAGDAGELVLRDLRNGSTGRACGFLDDDPEKLGMRIHGVPVLAPTNAVVEIAATMGIDEIVLAIPRASAEKRALLARLCQERHLSVRQFEIAPAILAAPAVPEPSVAHR